MGIENKNYRKDFKRFDDKSFILDDFDDVEVHVDPYTVLHVSTSRVGVHCTNHSHDEPFAL